MTEGVAGPRRVLVWLAGALGDSLLLYPALASLRQWAPEAEITIAGNPAYFCFARASGLVDGLLDAGRRDGALLFAGNMSMLPGPPDLAIVWSMAYQDMAARLVAGGVTRLIAAPSRPSDERHQARYLLDCLGPLGVPRTLMPAPISSPLPPPPFLQGVLDASASRSGVLLHPGAGAAWKQWRMEGFVALAARLTALGSTVWWSFGPADADLRRYLEHAGDGVPGVLLPPLSLDDLASVVGSSALAVSGDTGVAHLAALWQVPQVVLFGPTNPRRWRPLSRRATIVRAPDLCGGTWPPRAADPIQTLRRCAVAQNARCECLDALSADHVEAACKAALNAHRKQRRRLASQAQSASH